MSTLFWILLGAYIGWNVPQPEWARSIQNKIVNTLRDNTSK